MSKRTLGLIVILFLSTIVLLVIAMQKSSSPSPVQQTIQNIVKPPVAQTILSFGELSATPSSLPTTTTHSIPVRIQTNSNKVTAVQLEIQYDTQTLDKVSIQPGNFFTNPVILFSDIDSKNGRVSFAIGINPTEQGIKGGGIVATLNFAAKSPYPTQTSLVFLPKSLVTAEGIAQSVLKSTTSADIVVEGTSSRPQNSF